MIKNEYQHYNSKQLLFCSRDHELKLIDKLYYMIMSTPLRTLKAKDILFMNVSPDYSGIVSTILSHKFATEGILSKTECIQVPYPKEDCTPYSNRFKQEFKMIQSFNGCNENTHYILVEAGILSGRNYTWITDIMKKDYGISDDNITTTALFQNVHSKYNCSFVGEYFDYTRQDLCFWWEQPNMAFGDLSNWM